MDSKLTRGFEICVEENPDEITLPKRGTSASAGYDFYAKEDVVIPSIFQSALRAFHEVGMKLLGCSEEEQEEIFRKYFKPAIVATGVKAKMPEDEVLMLHIRSSVARNRGLMLANGTGIIDADYYSNEGNDGNIGFMFHNFSPFPVTIKKGERIGQGIFMKYKTVNEDEAEGRRVGGTGSTGK